MAKKHCSGWRLWLLGLGVFLGADLLLAVVTAWLAVQAILPETMLLPASAVSCGLSVLVGSLVIGQRKSPMGPVGCGAVCGLAAAAVLAVLGLLLWRQTAFLGSGGVVAASALAGGLAAGLLCRWRISRRRMRRLRR